jgi:hypothetical protein
LRGAVEALAFIVFWASCRVDVIDRSQSKSFIWSD